MGAGAALTGSMTRPLTDWTAGSALGAGFSAVRRANFCTGSAARGKRLKGTGAAGEAGAGRWAFTGSMGAGRSTCGTGFAGLLAAFAGAAWATGAWTGAERFTGSLGAAGAGFATGAGVAAFGCGAARCAISRCTGCGGLAGGALWGGAAPFRDFIEALYAEKVRWRNRIAQCNIRLARLVGSGRI